MATTSITSAKLPLEEPPPNTTSEVLQQISLPLDIRPRDNATSGGIKLLRPKSSHPSPSRRQSDSPLVKHPMRLVAAKLMASLHETSNQTQSNQTNQNPRQGVASHAYFQDIYWQVAAQLEQQPSTAGLAQVLKHIWHEYVDPLHDKVEHSNNRLGCSFSNPAPTLNARKLALASQVGRVTHTTRVTRRKPSHMPRHEMSSEKSGLTAQEDQRNRNNAVAASHSTQPAFTESDTSTLRRRRSQTALTFDHVDQVHEIQKILSAKVKALRLELISMQRLRESIFATVVNADAARQKNIDTRMRLRISAQLEQTLQKRYSVVSDTMTLAAVHIQRMARGKLAGKRIRLARIVALMKMSKEMFRHKLQKREWNEFDNAPDTTPIEQLEDEMKTIVWEVTRLVRDLSLDWWKLSLSEERARLTWEVNDAKDDLRLLQQQTSVLVQNCTLCMNLVSDPVVPKTHEARLGVHQYYSPSPRVPDTTKEMLESVSTTNSKLEDFIFTFAKSKQQRTAIATQTDPTLQKQPTYLQALAKLAQVQNNELLPTTPLELPEDNPATDTTPSLPPQSYSVEPTVDISSTAISPIEAIAATLPTATESTKIAKRTLHRSPKSKTPATTAVPGLKDMPRLLAAEFKLIGKSQAYKGKVMGVAQLKLLLHEVYGARMADELRAPVGEFLYRFFALKYGLRNVAEMYLVNFVTSLKKYWKADPEIRLCARLCHIKHTTPLSLDAFDYYVGLLAGIGVHQNEAAIPHWFVPHLTRQAVDLIQQYEPGCMLELVHHDPDTTYKSIESKLYKLSPVATHQEIGLGVATLTFVDRDEALTTCLDAFEAVESAIHDHLLQAFQTADIDKNGVLCFAEFNSLVQKVYLTPESHVRRMFFDAIALSGHPFRDAILPEVFVTLAKKEGLSRKSYVSQRRDAITSPIDMNFLESGGGLLPPR
ncbi:hypothetical protein, variant 1 [Aphanomyces astaci]|nr:hypothetical protein, variant 1 [Aphanomyces astaci]ETV67719.1 hypothetical protein, variant 1 [Aphanomyces astaci]|eukprot:XP_009842841.1 hypothetical protein, variant 1 [Aphanomyces astaci]